MKLLFIFGNDEYKKGKKGKNLKVQVQIIFETRRHSRSQESPVSLLLIQRNRQKQKPNTTKTRHPPKKNKKNSILPRVIIPRNKTNDEYRNTDSTYRLVITIF